MKKVLLLASTVIVLTLSFQSAMAIPALQVYIPGATWDAPSQTWVTSSGDFELWIIAANTDSKPIYDLTMVFALAQGAAPVTDALSIDGTYYNTYSSGTPPSWGDNMGAYPPHGVYPTNYLEYGIASLVDTYPETVHNMQPGQFDDSAPGKIFKFDIITTYEWLHIDGYGFHDESDGHFKFVPNSHDGLVVPEPGTLLLLGSALALAGAVRRFRK